MPLNVVLKIGGRDYSITSEKGKVSVSGGDEFLSAAVQKLVESAAEEYSPAMGGKATYIANSVVGFVGGEVVSVEEPPSEKGVVY